MTSRDYGAWCDCINRRVLEHAGVRVGRIWQDPRGGCRTVVWDLTGLCQFSYGMILSRILGKILPQNAAAIEDFQARCAMEVFNESKHAPDCDRGLAVNG